jgi:hypothetical protein
MTEMCQGFSDRPPAPQPTGLTLSSRNSQALFSISQVLVPRCDLDELVRVMAPKLSGIVAFDDLSLSVWGAGTVSFFGQGIRAI